MTSFEGALDLPGIWVEKEEKKTNDNFPAFPPKPLLA